MKPKSGSFLVMSHRLTKALRQPPSLSHMQGLLSTADELLEFIELVRRFLPKYEKEIMNQKGAFDRCNRFCACFPKEYGFELADYCFEEYPALTRQIPIYLNGINYSDYDEMIENWPADRLCLMALIAYPFVGIEMADGRSHRVPVLDKCRAWLSDETLKRIPPEGFLPKTLHEKLDGNKKFEGFLVFADWVHSETNNPLLDCNMEDTPDGPSWDEEEIEALKEWMPAMIELEKKMGAFESWLKEDLKAHFAELLNAIVGTGVPKEQMGLPLVEVFKDDHGGCGAYMPMPPKKKKKGGTIGQERHG